MSLLRECKSLWEVTVRSVGQDGKGCPFLTGPVSATEMDLKGVRGLALKSDQYA